MIKKLLKFFTCMLVLTTTCLNLNFKAEKSNLLYECKSHMYMHRYYNENKKIYTIVFLFNPVRFVRNEFYKDESPECIVIDDCVLNTLLYKDIFMLEKNFIENLIFNLVKTGEWVMMRERRWVVVAKVSAICRVGGLDKFWGEDEDGEENNLSDFVVDCLDNLDIKLYKFYLKDVNIQEKFFL